MRVLSGLSRQITPRIGITWLGLGMLFLLSSCSTLPPAVQSPSAIEQSRQKLRSVRAFTLKGRMAFRQDDVNYPLRFDWSYQIQSQRLELTAPLGQGWLILESTPTHAVLETSKGQLLREKTLDQLLRGAVGFDVPVTQMRFWVVGLPSPDYSFEATENEAGLYTEILQQGWRVVCRDFEMNEGVWVPKRITATRDNLEVRIIVNQRVLLFGAVEGK